MGSRVCILERSQTVDRIVDSMQGRVMRAKLIRVDRDIAISGLVRIRRLWRKDGQVCAWEVVLLVSL